MFPIHDENPVDIVPWVTYSIIGLCVGVFLWQISASQAMQQSIVYALGVIPAVIFGHDELPRELVWVPTYVTIFSSMFLHGGWMHLIGNMLYLWVFGNNIEASMGPVKFVIFYLLCGVAAVLAQSLPGTDSVVPMIGASGAISGVLGAYMLLYPKARVTVVVPIFFILQTFKIPALYVLAIWFAMQLISSLSSSGVGGGVAFGAHVGGFIAGMLLIAVFKNKQVLLQIPFVHFHPFRH